MPNIQLEKCRPQWHKWMGHANKVLVEKWIWDLSLSYGDSSKVRSNNIRIDDLVNVIVAHAQRLTTYILLVCHQALFIIIIIIVNVYKINAQLEWNQKSKNKVFVLFDHPGPRFFHLLSQRFNEIVVWSPHITSIYFYDQYDIGCCKDRWEISSKTHLLWQRFNEHTCWCFYSYSWS